AIGVEAIGLPDGPGIDIGRLVVEPKTRRSEPFLGRIDYEGHPVGHERSQRPSEGVTVFLRREGQLMLTAVVPIKPPNLSSRAVEAITEPLSNHGQGHGAPQNPTTRARRGAGIACAWSKATTAATARSILRREPRRSLTITSP